MTPPVLENNSDKHFPQTRRSHVRIWWKLVLPPILSSVFWENHLSYIKTNRMRNIHAQNHICLITMLHSSSHRQHPSLNSRVYQARLVTAHKQTKLFCITLILWEKAENIKFLHIFVENKETTTFLWILKIIEQFYFLNTLKPHNMTEKYRAPGGGSLDIFTFKLKITC